MYACSFGMQKNTAYAKHSAVFNTIAEITSFFAQLSCLILHPLRYKYSYVSFPVPSISMDEGTWTFYIKTTLQKLFQ